MIKKANKLKRKCWEILNYPPDREKCQKCPAKIYDMETECYWIAGSYCIKTSAGRSCMQCIVYQTNQETVKNQKERSVS